jgi:hypothetical protein
MGGGTETTERVRGIEGVGGASGLVAGRGGGLEHKMSEMRCDELLASEQRRVHARV